MLKIIIPVVKHHGRGKLEEMMMSSSPGSIYVDECKMCMCDSTYTEQESLKSRKSPAFQRSINTTPVLLGVKQKPRDWTFSVHSLTARQVQNGIYRRAWCCGYGSHHIQNLGLSSSSATDQLCGLRVTFNPALSLCRYFKRVGYRVFEACTYSSHLSINSSCWEAKVSGKDYILF